MNSFLPDGTYAPGFYQGGYPTMCHPFFNYMMFLPSLTTYDSLSVRECIESSDRGTDMEGEEMPSCSPQTKKTEVLMKIEEVVEEKGNHTIQEEKGRQMPPKVVKRKPCVQKESRNIVSNLLRIFFKNILEVTSYDDRIGTLLKEGKIEATPQDFYLWLERFKINFKNYIKPTQIKKILTGKGAEQYQSIFRILLRHFTSQIGILHCLTSKRIVQNCTRKHLEGLKNLVVLGSEKRV